MSQPQQPGSTGPHSPPLPDHQPLGQHPGQTGQYSGQPGQPGQQAPQYGAPTYGSGPQHGGTQYGGPQQYVAQQGSAPQHSAPPQYGAAPQYGSGPAAPGPYPPQGSFPQHGTGPAQPGRKPKKPLLKRWWFWVLAVLALFIAIGIAGGGGDDSATDTSASDQAADAQPADEAPADEDAAEEDTADEAADDSAEDAPAAYGLGDAVPTGDWEITVADVETGVSEVGDQYLNSTAQGQYILVDVEVKNTGSEPSYFFEDNVKLLDDAGNTYATDSEASLYTTESGDVFLLEEINPGNTASGVLVFDVPADASPNVLEFQGGIFDTPAEVALD
jgi:hypothetical protein